MHSSIYFSICFAFSTVSIGLGYGQKWWRPKPQCDEFDPPAVRNLNFDDIAGKWYFVRLKPATFHYFESESTRDEVVEWICGTNKAIRNARLLDKPNMRVIFLLEFVPIPGTDRSAFRVYFEDRKFAIEWRVLHFDSKFLITWGCFARDRKNRCIDWASRVFSRTPNATISDRDLRRLDMILKRTTCDRRIRKEYQTRIVGNECRDWSLRQPTECPKRY